MTDRRRERSIGQEQRHSNGGEECGVASSPTLGERRQDGVVIEQEAEVGVDGRRVRVEAIEIQQLSERGGPHGGGRVEVMKGAAFDRQPLGRNRGRDDSHKISIKCLVKQCCGNGFINSAISIALPTNAAPTASPTASPSVAPICIANCPNGFTNCCAIASPIGAPSASPTVSTNCRQLSRCWLHQLRRQLHLHRLPQVPPQLLRLKVSFALRGVECGGKADWEVASQLIDRRRQRPSRPSAKSDAPRVTRTTTHRAPS